MLVWVSDVGVRAGVDADAVVCIVGWGWGWGRGVH